MKNTKRNLSGVTLSLVELIVGILLLMNPVGFTSGIIIACGILLMFLGVVSIIRYFRTEPAEAAVSQLFVKGSLELVGGAFCAFNSRWFLITFPVLTLIYGVVILIAGMTKLQWMLDIIRMKRRRWFLTGISAALSFLCGVVIITNPFSTMAVLWMFIGISLIAEAVFDVVAMIFGNKEAPAEEEKPDVEQ